MERLLLLASQDLLSIGEYMTDASQDSYGYTNTSVEITGFNKTLVNQIIYTSPTVCVYPPFLFIFFQVIHLKSVPMILVGFLNVGM